MFPAYVHTALTAIDSPPYTQLPYDIHTHSDSFIFTNALCSRALISTPGAQQHYLLLGAGLFYNCTFSPDLGIPEWQWDSSVSQQSRACL